MAMRHWILLLPLAFACSSPEPKEEPVRPEVKPTYDERLAEWKKFEKDAMSRYSVREQQEIAESGYHYRLALAFFQSGDFDRAKEQAQKAVDLWISNLEARKLLGEINEILTGGPEDYGGRTPAENQVMYARIAVEQAKLEITNHMRDGERYYNARMYEDALREFHRAEYKIVNLPYDTPALETLLPDIREKIGRAKHFVDR